MKWFKKFLYRNVSFATYLRWMHTGFFFLFDIGFLRKKEEFKYHYAVSDWLKEDDRILDIGANLGYFAKIFARKAHKGKVLCIEPIPDFYEVLLRKLGKFNNVEVVHTALGPTQGKVKMVLPTTDDMIRTGLPHIPRENETTSEMKTVEVPIQSPTDVLQKLDRIDYIKCDVEGFEREIFRLMEEELAQNLPIVQVEIAPENVDYFLGLFGRLGYQQYGLAEFKLVRDSYPQKEPGDFLFIPPNKLNRFRFD